MKSMNGDKIIEQMALERNWSENTINSYAYTIRIYTSYFNMSMEDLIKEAEEEEEQGIMKKRRTLKRRLIEFRNHLVNNYVKSSVTTAMQRIRTIYTHYEIEIPQLPYMSNKNMKDYEPVMFNDLPTKEILRDAIRIASPLMRAAILFQSSSGCAKKETLNFTIRDFFKGCGVITENVNEGIKEIEGMKEVVPMFKIQRAKVSEYYYTFCSPEAVRFILDYLKHRKPKSVDEKLFKINGVNFSINYEKLNERLELGKVGAYGRLISHRVRKYNSTYLANGNNRLSLDDIDFFHGRAKGGTRKRYFFENPEKVKEMYIEALPDIVLFDDIKHINYKSKEFRKMEQELDGLKEQVSKLTLQELF